MDYFFLYGLTFDVEFAGEPVSAGWVLGEAVVPPVVLFVHAAGEGDVINSRCHFLNHRTLLGLVVVVGILVNILITIYIFLILKIQTQI